MCFLRPSGILRCFCQIWRDRFAIVGLTLEPVVGIGRIMDQMKACGKVEIRQSLI
jgi:hypothetical protein